MRAFSTVGINDDLTACQTRIAMRSANNELTGGVDMEFDVIIKKL